MVQLGLHVHSFFISPASVLSSASPTLLLSGFTNLMLLGLTRKSCIRVLVYFAILWAVEKGKSTDITLRGNEDERMKYCFSELLHFSVVAFLSPLLWDWCYIWGEKEKILVISWNSLVGCLLPKYSSQSVCSGFPGMFQTGYRVWKFFCCP